MSKEEFTKKQEAAFSLPEVVQSIGVHKANVPERMKVIAASALPLPESPRVMDIGCGTGLLIPFLQEAGMHDILAVDLSAKMLEALQTELGTASMQGNNPEVRVWKGDFVDVPSYMGPVDVVFFNAVFGNLYSQRDALIKAASFLSPMGKVVVSHPMGSKFQASLIEENPETVIHTLPTSPEWKEMTSDLPLSLESYKNEENLYIAVLQIPENYSFEGAPLFLEGEVILGRGIGSAKLGVPTANLQPDSFQEVLKDQPRGVYFGWAKVVDSDEDEVHGAVFNLGICPTLKGDTENISLEAHILHSFKEDFHGWTLKVALTGFLRPEMKFSGVDELLTQIKTDIGKARNQLKSPELIAIQKNSFFSS